MGREIQYGGQSVISFVLSCHRSKICQKDSPHQNVFQTNLESEVFLCFQKRQAVQIYIFIEPKFRPDKHHLCTGSRSNESNRRNLAEKPAYFAGCRLLSTNLQCMCLSQCPRPCLRFSSRFLQQVLTNFRCNLPDKKVKNNELVR